MLSFGKALPVIRDQIGAALNLPGPPLLMRVGNEEYVRTSPLQWCDGTRGVRRRGADTG